MRPQVLLFGEHLENDHPALGKIDRVTIIVHYPEDRQALETYDGALRAKHVFFNTTFDCCRLQAKRWTEAVESLALTTWGHMKDPAPWCFEMFPNLKRAHLGDLEDVEVDSFYRQILVKGLEKWEYDKLSYKSTPWSRT